MLFFLFGIFVLNFLYLSGFLSDHHQSDRNRSIIKYASEDVKSNEILLKLNIMDIYRLDISCDYIVDALGAAIDAKYRNSEKKCALANSKSDVNKFIDKSLSDEHLSRVRSKSYKPYLEANARFDPFGEASDEFEQFRALREGGHWLPEVLKADAPCKPKDLEHILFIVPFSRNRLENLKLFLINMHAYLQRLRRPFEYRILVAEQRNTVENQLFNKGSIMNRAVQFALEQYTSVDCIVLHDVDIVPLRDGDGADYRCNLMPSHLTRRVYLQSTEKVRLYNQFLTGGVLSLRPHHIIAANGYSNFYFGYFFIFLFSFSFTFSNLSFYIYSSIPKLGR